MTIASLTATTTAPSTAPKGSASPVQTATVAPDSQVPPEAPVLSSLEMTVAVARQSAAARQDGLSMLMANLLRATAAGNLPTTVQQAVDQLLALHLPTDVAPDAAAMKTALLTSGLFTEATLASSAAGIPTDIKTALLQLNTAAENWLARTAASTSSLPAPTGLRPEQAVPVAAPIAREPNRRSSPRTNEAPGAKPAAPGTSGPQCAAPGSSPLSIGLKADPAPEAETIKSALRLLGQVAQVLKASGAPEPPKEITAALVLVRNAIAPSLAALPAAGAEFPMKTATPVAAPATPPAPVMQRDPSPQQRPSTNNPTPPIAKPLMASPVAPISSEMLQASPPPAAGFAPRGSSPVEQLLALQLTPASLPAPIASPAAASSSAKSALVETSPAPPSGTGVGRTPPAPTPLTAGQPDTGPVKPNGAAAVVTSAAPSSVPPSPAIPSSTLPSATSTPGFTPAASPALPNDVKTLVTLFAAGLEAMLPRTPATRDAPQQPNIPSRQTNTLPQEPNAGLQQPAPTDIAAAISTLSNAGLLPSAPSGVPNDLKTLLLLFNMVAESWLPRATSAAGAAGTPSVPPPVKGAASRGQPTALATLPENADPVATAKQLLSGSDAALARQTLLQIASLPDASPQNRDARWMFDVPLMTAQGAAVAQMIIERDSSGASAETPTPVWRVQFAIDIEPLGPVRANLALSGERAWVTISADRPESLDKLQSGVSWLADALQSNALEADIAFQPGLPSQLSANASRFMDHAS